MKIYLSSMNAEELILNKFKVSSYEELSDEEQVSFDSMVRTLEGKTLTLENARDYIKQVKDGIIKKLIEEPEYNYIFIFKIPNRQHLYLKARLKNIILLDDMFNSPIRAKKSLEKYLNSVK